MLWRVGVALCFAIFALLSARGASAQERRDPLIDPPQGGAGSRFQIVGQQNWVPGERVALRVGYTASDDPLTHAGPWQLEQTITVLRDGRRWREATRSSRPRPPAPGAIRAFEQEPVELAGGAASAPGSERALP